MAARRKCRPSSRGRRFIVGVITECARIRDRMRQGEYRIHDEVKRMLGA